MRYIKNIMNAFKMLRMTCFSTVVCCRPAPPAPVLLPPGGPHHHRAFPGHRAHTPQVPRERTGWSYVWIKDCIVEKNYPNFPSGKLDHWWNNFFTWSQHKIVILMANLCHFDWVCIIGKIDFASMFHQTILLWLLYHEYLGGITSRICNHPRISLWKSCFW